MAEETTEFIILAPEPNDQPQLQDEMDKPDFYGCWSVDNVVVVNTADTPTQMADMFDPIDPSNWIFFPRMEVKQACQSHGNALVSEFSKNESVQFAVTRDLDLSLSESQDDTILSEDFDDGLTSLKLDSGHVSSQCGQVHEGLALIFNGPKKRRVCTHDFSPVGVDSVQFYFRYGGGSCHHTSQSPPVLLYLEDEDDHTLVLQKLEADAFMSPHLVSQPLFDGSAPQHHGLVRLCLLQKSHSGPGQDIWAIDSVRLLPLLPQSGNAVLQASLQLNCGTGGSGEEGTLPKEGNVVKFEYSTNHGDSWHDLYTPCIPAVCNGQYQPLTSSFAAKDLSGWQRIVLPLPYGAQSPFVRFRVRHEGEGGSVPWAIDDVYIGPCQGFCSGHGMCTDDGCSCDFGYKGDKCEESVIPASTELQETFEFLDGSSLTVDVKGGKVGYQCGVVSSGKALVFDSTGPREIVTAELDTREAKNLQFTLRIGSHSPVSTCPSPDDPLETILLESSCDGGVHWALLQEFNPEDFHEARSVSLTVPAHAQGMTCQFRWRQPHHSGQGRDVWAIDDLHLTSDPNSMTLAVEMMDMPDFGDQMGSNLGKLVDSFCHKMRSVVFSSPEKNGEPRSLVSKPMRVGPGYIAQFDLVLGCGLPFADGLKNHVVFQYTVDHGISWHKVEDPCLPPAVCDEYTEGSVYHPSVFQDWRTVTVILSPNTWGPQTKFRWIQEEWADSDVWGVNRVYIGHPCPSHCNGQGSCHSGTCRCNEGFSGESCTPDFQMDSSIQADFGLRYDPDLDFMIAGGEVVRAGEGCGEILSGENVYFSGKGVRELKTKDLNTTSADFIQFFVRLGGDSPECTGMERREESVLLQYSTDGGISWTLLKELHHLEYKKTKFVHLDLPNSAKSPHARFRWWQPQHSGEGTDQWAVDEVLIGRYRGLRSLHDDFDSSIDPQESDQWRRVTEGAVGKYCGSLNPSLVMGNQMSDKEVITHDIHTQPGDVIQFKINVDCVKVFGWDHPVILQYSQDNGQTWSLVTDPCYLDQDCEGKPTEGSIYYAGTHGQWTLVVIPVGEKIAMHPSIFRWWQPGGVAHSFSLEDVYIGPPCPENCHRRGVCEGGQCRCLHDTDKVVGNDNCEQQGDAPAGLLDRFDNRNMPSMRWERISGGHLSRACGTLDNGNSLYFGGVGTREAVTVPLNTSEKKIMEFTVQIGSDQNTAQCRRARGRDEAVVVDFSNDNGITWQVLQVVEPDFDQVAPHTVMVELPAEARQNRTIFRFWQPLGFGGMPRAEWAIDSVLIGVNTTSADGFQDEFTGMMPNPNHWFLADEGVQRQTCDSRDSALEFSNKNGEQVAETWDYNVSPSTFLQFDLAMGCGALSGEMYNLQLEYSVDHGKSWQSVMSKCAPPDFQCPGYHLSSTYMSERFNNWTRITVSLPEGAISPATRFRWVRPDMHKGGPIWAIDNVYLGNGCPWMCSGQGSCQDGKCHCDPGFGGEYCVPTTPLPMTIRDNFNSPKVDSTIWKEVYGGRNSLKCGSVVSGKSFTFDEDGLRMAVTQDMDTSMLLSMEFFFRYGCGVAETSLPWPRMQSVLVQYSTNGGITWKLVREIHFDDNSEAKFFSIPLPMSARMNATRFRFWQPMSGGAKTWSIDNLFIGSMAMNPNSMYDSFDFDQADPMSWGFINNGEVEQYCHQHTGPDSRMSGESALVLRRREGGELSVTTADLEIGPLAIMQFDINVGCGAEASAKYPVKLEYTLDGGLTWDLVGQPTCVPGSPCSWSGPHTVYYAGDSLSWRRVVVPLGHLRVCGPIRFRWYQGSIPDDQFAPEWALDNVYIGTMCVENCHGHGSCIGGMMCDCDEGYGGTTCVALTQLPGYLKESFPVTDVLLQPGGGLLQPSSSQTDINPDHWQFWSSGGVTDTDHCGKVFTGPGFLHSGEGQRTLTTVPLDLTTANTIQFYIKLGCQGPKSDSKGTQTDASPPVFLQYTTDGGVGWNTIEKFEFSPFSKDPKYIAVHIPLGARTNATQIRWWQPSPDGTYSQSWAIDQIYIGGNSEGELTLQDEASSPKETTWLDHPGASKEPVCDSEGIALHFKDQEPERFASTADVSVHEGSLLQFDLSMGCDVTKAKEKPCFSLRLEYSLDLGNTWHLLISSCHPSNVECGLFHTGSVFSSDVYAGWHRVNVPIPQHAWSSETRFRVYQGSEYSLEDSWAVRNLYVGSMCPSRCSGHGRCGDNNCVCDAGWSGAVCDVADSSLPYILVDDFTPSVSEDNWVQLVGGAVTKPCRRLAAGDALHFTGPCSRLLETRPLNLTRAMYIQYYFMFGCSKAPESRDAGVLVEYSTDQGISWLPVTEMHYNLYRAPTFISLLIPEGAKREGTQLRWWQPQHRGQGQDDWLMDGLRINGDKVNPLELAVNFTSGLQYLDLITADNMEVSHYCGKDGVALGRTPTFEPSTLISREVAVKLGYVLQFSINVGCGKAWNASLMPVSMKYSTDHGMSWTDVVTLCPTNTPCFAYSNIAGSHYHGSHDNWRRVVIPLNELAMSNGTRFQWQQHPNGMPGTQDWGLADIYIGPACPDSCTGRGFCFKQVCVCDNGYGGDDCSLVSSDTVRTQVKDSFDQDHNLNQTRWPWVQGGMVQRPCRPVVSGTALVFNGPGGRELVSPSLDLRSARFVQYTALMYNSGPHTCNQPTADMSQHVFLQYSFDGGLSWHTLHVLTPARYWPSGQDYIGLPLTARTDNTLIRWVQSEPSSNTVPRLHWALDDVYIGGWDINPSQYEQHFDPDDLQDDDPDLWEFSPNGEIKDSSDSCVLEGEEGSSAMVWPMKAGGEKEDKEGEEEAYMFTTNQLIVQRGYLLQFKLIIGCGAYPDTCTAPDSVVALEYRRDPKSSEWSPLVPTCLPGSQDSGRCNPQHHHHASLYSLTQAPQWTRFTIPLDESTHSGWTQFRWVQRGNTSVVKWGLDDISVGEQCPDMCSGRGECHRGVCACDTGYLGPSCLPNPSKLLKRLFDSFEGGIFQSHWERVRGGGIGFGCGALLPYAHGKTLYFNGCGEREAVTAEMDTTNALKIIFVIQIGCPAQTEFCNVQLGDGPKYRGVLLQYSKNKGAEWHLIAQHDAVDFLRPRRVAYDIPGAAKQLGTQFRWWQPLHDGKGFDQWAIDHVEIISGRRHYRRRRWKG